MSQSPVTVRPVVSDADLKTLIAFPWALYADDPLWVPPLVSQRRFAFDREHNPIFDYVDADCFIAWRGGRPVGTVAAAINHRHNDFHNERIGFFGHFDVYEDPEAADALLNTAIDWVRARGMTAIRGPLSLTVNDDSAGCLIEGFDTPRMLLMGHNPPYYARLIEAAGFAKEMDLLAWRGDARVIAASDGFNRMRRIAEKQAQRRNITIRRGDVRRMEEEIRLLQQVYQESWADNWGYVPPTEREIDHLVKDLKQFYDDRLGFFAEKGGETVGFILLLPNLNQVLWRAYPRPGVPEPITLLKALWHWKVRPKIDAVRVLLLGVRAAYRGQGVDALLMSHAFNATVSAGYRWGEASWILENNDAMNSILDVLGFEVYKRYRVYQRPV
ncbi:MAG: GNAT family N-acetyltransferase [Anaerolineae bacterium]